MILFPDSAFFLFIPVYVLALVVAFFLPGDLLLRTVPLTTAQRVTLSFTIGIALWALQGFIFGQLGLRDLTYLYLLVVSGLWLLKRGVKFKLTFPKAPGTLDILSLVIILSGGFLQLAAVWLMGFQTSSGDILFCCRSVPDGIYHLALTSELVNHFPPMEPGSAGIVVKNYHYLSNLALADLARIFRPPLIPTVYQYSSVFLIGFMAAAVIAISQLLALGKNFQRLFLFFTFFAGDLLYILVFLRTKTINLDYTIIDDASKLLTGPPRSFSLALFLGLVALILVWLRDKKLILGLLVGIVTGILLEFKVYTGIVAFAGLGTLVLVRLYKKDWYSLGIAFLALATSLLTFLPINDRAGGLIFSGTWRFDNFMAQSIFHFQTLELTRLSLIGQGQHLKVLGIELFYAATYLISMLGVALLAFWQTKHTLKRIPLELVGFYLAVLTSSLLLGLFFVQATGGANTIQFIIQYLTLAALPLALSIDSHFKRLPKLVFRLLLGLIIILAATRTLHEGLGNIISYSTREKFLFSSDRLKIAAFLADGTQKNSILLIGSNEAFSATAMSLPLFSKRSVYLAGTSDHGVVGLEARIKANQTIIESTNCAEVAKLIKVSQATILIRPTSKSLPCEDNLQLDPLFQAGNDTVFSIGQN